MAETKVGKVSVDLELKVKKWNEKLGKAQQKLGAFGEKATDVGKKMTMKLTAPILGMGIGAFKAAMDFETSMTQIESLVGRSAEEVSSLGEEVKRLSGETARSPKELADAMFFITSAGLDAASAVTALEYSAKAAAAGLGDTEVVADAVTNAMNGYSLSADGAAYATDVLVKTVEQGKAAAADLAPQFGRLVPVAAELGVEFDQVGAGIAYLTRSSGDASLSATQLTGILNTIIKPSQQAKDTLEAVGSSVAEFRAEVAEGDLLSALRSLRTRLEENGHEMAEVFENSRALTGALALTGDGAEAAEQVFNELANAAGKTDEAFEVASKTTKFKLNKAMTEFKTAMVSLGEKIIPVVIPLIQSIGEWIGKVSDAFDNLSPAIQKTVIILAGLVAAGGPAIYFAGKMATSVASLTAAFGKAMGTKGGAGFISMVSKMGPALMSPVGLATAAVAVVVGVTLFKAFKKSREEAKRAMERQEKLTDQFRAQGDEATTLVDRTKALIEAHEKLTVTTEGTTEAASEFMGDAVLMSELLKGGVARAFNSLSIEAGVLEAALATGSDQFEEFEKQAKYAGSTSDEDLVRGLRNADAAIVDVTSALADQFEQGVISRDELKNMLGGLDETADAFDDHRKEVEKTHKEYLLSTEALDEFASVLGMEATVAVIEAAKENKDYTGGLETLNAMVAEGVAEQDALVGGFEAADAALLTWAADVGAEALPAVVDLSANVAALIANIEAGIDPLNRTAYELEQMTVASQDADAAMLSWAESNSPEALNRAFWAAEAAREAAHGLEVEYQALLETEQQRKRNSSELYTEVKAAADEQERLEMVARKAGAAAEYEAREIERLRDQFNAMVSDIRGVVDQQFALGQSFDDIADAEQRLIDFTTALAEEGVALGGVFSKQTEEGRSARDMVQNYTREIADTIALLRDTGAPLDEIAETFTAQKEALRSVLEQMGLNEGQIQPYIDALNLIPSSIDTEMQVKLNPVMGALADLYGTTDVEQIKATLGASLMGFAAGGIVTQPTLGVLGEAGPEAVIPLGRAGGLGGTTVNVIVEGSVLSERDLADSIHSELLRAQNRNRSLEFN